MIDVQVAICRKTADILGYCIPILGLDVAVTGVSKHSVLQEFMVSMSGYFTMSGKFLLV